MSGMMRKAVVIPAVLAAGIACAPLAQAGTGGGTQASAEQAVQQVYNQVQRGCTPRTPPQFQSISWSLWSDGDHGVGRINDAKQGLGGPFQVYWNIGSSPFPGARVVPAQPSGYWDVVLEFC